MLDGAVNRGWVEWHEQTDGEVPALVVDGQVISWERFGRMLMSYEGWRYRGRSSTRRPNHSGVARARWMGGDTSQAAPHHRPVGAKGG